MLKKNKSTYNLFNDWEATCELYPDKIDPEMLQNLRIHFLSARDLLGKSNDYYLNECNFYEPFNEENEKKVFEFLLKNINSHL